MTNEEIYYAIQVWEYKAFYTIAVLAIILIVMFKAIDWFANYHTRR